jgi:hypothetical protein
MFLPFAGTYMMKNATRRGGLMVFCLKILIAYSFSISFHKWDPSKDH